jgi:hypothetical protein
MSSFNPIPSNLFTYSADTRNFVTEASDLKEHDILQRINYYPDGRGFSIKSTKTGKTVDFLLARTERSEGEVQAWQFQSADGAYSATIFND